MTSLREKRSRNINLNLINMKVKIFSCITLFFLFFVISCNKSSNSLPLVESGQQQTDILQLLQQIDSLEYLNDNVNIVLDYITKAEKFSDLNPEDNMSPEFLYKAALMSMTLAKLSDNIQATDLYSQKALSIFDDIERIYPDFSGIKNCMFNKGVVYDDILRDYQNAEIYYRAFMAKYPTDTLSSNLEIYLQYLGKSPEEILAGK